MDPEIKKLLERNTELTEENNTLLRKMHRSARFGTLMHVAYWLVLLVLSLGAFYFVDPYVKQITSVYSGAKSDLDSISHIKDSLQNLGK